MNIFKEKETDSLAEKIDFADLYSSCKADMYRFAFFYLKNREDAEDACQDAVLRAYRGIHTLKDPVLFKNWIFTILVRCCKQKIPYLINRRSDAEYDEAAYISTDPTETVINTITLENEINKLNKRERMMVWLSVTAGYKSAEIAEVMGVSSGVVRTGLSRTFAKIRKQMEQQKG